MPRFGKDKNARNEELDRQAAEEVERLTRRGGPPGMGGGMGGGAPQIMNSPLDMIAAEMADKPRPSMRRQESPRRAGPKPQQAFTPMPSGEVGSSFGPGGLNPGPRMAGAAPPPPTFGGGDYDDDYGGHVSGPPVYNAGEPDEDEEMSITELALMDHAAHTGHSPEDLVMQYDASSAEEMRDEAMRKFYERQQARRPGPSTNSPFAPAGMRRGPSGGGGPARKDDPAAAGGALAQRLANRRRREEEEARQARAGAEPAPRAAASPAAKAEPAPRTAAPPAAKAGASVDDGALARVLARRRAALGVDAASAAEPEPEPTVTSGRRHAASRATASPGLRAVPASDHDDDDDDAPSLEDMAASTPTRRASAAKKPATTKKAATAKKPATAKKAPAAKKAAKKPAAETAPPARATKAKTAPAKKDPPAKKAAPAAKATKGKKAGATLAKAPAAKAAKTPASRSSGKAKTVFCIECGEKNPAIAKFCFNCGNRLAVAEG